MSDPTDKPLLLSELTTEISIVALGAVASKELMLKREAAFFVDQQGAVQLIPVAELLLDAIPETMAVQELLSQNIPESDIIAYLQGRDARMKSRGI